MKPLLAPVPQSIDLAGGTYSIARDRTIVLFGEAADHGVIAARSLQAAIERYAGARWETRAASGLAEREGVVAAIDPKIEEREGYHLTVGDERIGIVARDGAGLAYGFATLTQLVRQFGRRLPQLHVEDHPDFAHRGVLLDISRDKVPTMATLFGLVDMLAEWKINELHFNVEHTFAYDRHRAVWKDASPLTGEEALALDAYCAERHIELVPMQSSFGHMERWLVHKSYRDLAEVPEGVTLPHAKLLFPKRKRFPTTLNPADPRSLALLTELYAELLPHYRSRRMNVGCDETWELGQGRSKASASERGVGRVYLDFLLDVQRLCAQHGRQMMYWGDVVLQHPELIGELPRDAVALEWGYEHDHPYERDTRKFRKARIPYYVCPGAGGWLSLVGRTENAVANIRNAVENGRRRGAMGVLNTEWGDGGHMQPLPVAWLGFMYGAAMSWSPAASAEMDLARTLSLHAFDDPTGAAGRAVFDLGNAHAVSGATTRNGTLPAQLYFMPITMDHPRHRGRPGGWEDASSALADALARLASAPMRRDDAAQIIEEYRGAVEMADIGADVGGIKRDRAAGASVSKLRPRWRRAARRVEAVVPEYERLWHARNRPGGLTDSVARLKSFSKDMREAGE